MAKTAALQARMKILLSLSLLAWAFCAEAGGSDDSHFLSIDASDNPVHPASGTVTIAFVRRTNTLYSYCFNTNPGTVQYPNQPTPTNSSPLPLLLQGLTATNPSDHVNFANTMYLVGAPIPVPTDVVVHSGYYLIELNLNFYNTSTSRPVNYWIDEWAIIPNASIITTSLSTGQAPAGVPANSAFTRVIYTGDVPYQLTPLGPQNVTLHSTVYLTAGTWLLAPRIWTFDGPGTSKPSFCVEGVPVISGTAPSTVTVTLLKKD